MKSKKIKSLKSYLYKNKSAWESKKENDKTIDSFCDEYLQFISKNKTEREVIISTKKIFINNGYKNKKGNKFYITNRNKNIAIVKLGSNNLNKGVKIIVSHVDSPRLDLKQNPLYQDTSLALFKTHYYGGIKKYQWLTRALALHGLIILEDGTKINVNIGEDDNDPVFYIADLLPHLSRKVQNNKKVSEFIPGEKLNIIIGNKPLQTKDDSTEKVKLNIIKLLHKKYGIKEADFLTAELEIVPAGAAREIGLDRSLIGGYGQDDRICAFTSLKAILDSKKLKQTYIALLLDKEEIGSDGNTGAKGNFLKKVIKQCFENKNKSFNMVDIEECLFNSYAVSADVNGALNPDWKEVHEEKNAAKLGFGVCITKFTGSGGKYSASDANAEYVHKLSKILNKNNVIWQTGELGKIDEGGGGTIAKFIAEYGTEVIDMGPTLLAMHSPIELSSKVDIYMTYKAYKVFLEKLR